jgi:hypothetical protein
MPQPTYTMCGQCTASQLIADFWIFRCMLTARRGSFGRNRVNHTPRLKLWRKFEKKNYALFRGTKGVYSNSKSLQLYMKPLSSVSINHNEGSIVICLLRLSASLFNLFYSGNNSWNATTNGKLYIRYTQKHENCIVNRMLHRNPTKEENNFFVQNQKSSVKNLNQ